jgi:two-component sensor histidine kinase
MSLMLHEMATNALKHGALSVETGHIEIAWSIKGEGSNASLYVRWSEHGGPPAIQPTRHGFGSRLIRSGLTGAGKVQLHFLPTGLVGEFEAPLNWISAGYQS